MNQWKGELSWILALILSKSIRKWQNTILTFLIMVAKFLFIVIMINGTFCANSLLQLSSLSDWRELRSALIVKCVFNSCLSYTAIVLNVMTMYPVQKASPLPKNLTTLCQVLLLLKLEFGFICGCYFRRFLGIHLHLREHIWMHIQYISLYMDIKSSIFYLRFCDVIVHWNIKKNFCRRVQTPNFSM